MTQPGDDTAGEAGRGHLRASHADREQVIGILKAAYVQGMLAKDEFDLRVSQTLASKTYAQLVALTADLPAGLATPQPPMPARTQDEVRIPRPGRVLVVATVVYAGMWPLAMLLPGSGGGDPVDGLNLVILTGLAYMFVLLLTLAQISMDWQDKRARRQPPKGHASSAGGQASRRLPSVSPRRQFPPADPGHRQTAEAALSRRPLLPGWRVPVSVPCGR